MYWGGYGDYISVDQKKAQAQERIKKLIKKGEKIEPVYIEGKSIANTWWAKAWNKNLQLYADYTNRIGRGSSYVRNGFVLDLKISNGLVTALVSGKKIYNIHIDIAPLSITKWNTIKELCKGKIESVTELCSGKFPKDLILVFTDKDMGLFPSLNEMKFYCNCPDYAKMCKHISAVLYGIGARFDSDPNLFFTLRNVNISDLISVVVKEKTKSIIEKAKIKSKGTKILSDANLSSMFGVEVEGFDDKKVEVKSLNKKVKLKTTKTKSKSKKTDKSNKSKNKNIKNKKNLKKPNANKVKNA